MAGGHSRNFFNIATLDALGLTLGIAWTLALGLLLIIARGSSDGKGQGLSWEPVMVGAGLLVMAYAGNQAVMVVGVALAGLGIRESLRRTGNRGESAIFFRSLLIALTLLAASIALSGTVRAFLPPAGGVTQSWDPLVTVAATLAVMIAAQCWPFRYLSTFNSPLSTPVSFPFSTPLSLEALYSLAVPTILAKMLVAAPLAPVGAWAMVALGMVALLGSTYTFYVSGEVRLTTSALTGIIIVGLGLAPTSPVAAAGAIWLMLTGLLLAMAGDTASSWKFMRSSQVFTMLAGLPGVWLISQGALDTSYGVVAAFLLPAYALLMLRQMRVDPTISGKAQAITAFTILLATTATVYPQLPLEGIVRPVVGAMPGGVGTLSALASDWGVGLALRSAQETALAGLPATGIAVGVFLAAVSLYWLKQLLARLRRDDTADGQAE